MTGPLGSIAAAAPAVAMLAVFACLIGGGYLIVKKHNRTKGVLMIVLALVLFGNVLIMTL